MDLRELTELDKLNECAYECAKGSLHKEATQRYLASLLLNNIKLQEELRNGTYQVSKTVNFTLNERGKVRNIEVPAFRDRIVEKLLRKYIVEPWVRPHLIYDNYSSLKHRGTTIGRKRFEIMLRKHIQKFGKEGYIFLADIHHYFESIDRGILKEQLWKIIDEPPEICGLTNYCIDNFTKKKVGLNLGSELPQIFASLFLTKIDNYCKIVKGIKFYGRYNDDFFVICESKEQLKELWEEIRKILQELDLELNEKKTQIVKLSHGFTWLQTKYKIVGENNKILKIPTRQKIVRGRRRLKKYKKLVDNGLMTNFEAFNNYKSWRNSIVVDYNSYKRTIATMDQLAEELFGLTVKQSDKRTHVINEILKEVN